MGKWNNSRIPRNTFSFSSDIFSEETLSIFHNQGYSDSKTHTYTNTSKHSQTLACSVGRCLGERNEDKWIWRLVNDADENREMWGRLARALLPPLITRFIFPNLADLIESLKEAMHSQRSRRRIWVTLHPAFPEPHQRGHSSEAWSRWFLASGPKKEWIP